MKAIVYKKYGGPEVLQPEEVVQPVPKDDEVLVKIVAVSINEWDWGLLNGKPFINRMLFGWKKPKINILGSDIAGRIESVGKNCTKFKPGDEVYGDLSERWGGFAQYVCAPEKLLTVKPAGMSFEQAAAIPQASMLAIQGIRDCGKIKPNQKILINGAGGGVGSFGIQIAKLYNAEVTGVDNSHKQEMMRSFGFDHVIDYTQEDFTKNGRRYDMILDVKTNRSPFSYTRSLKRGGVYVTVGGSLGRLFQALVLSPFISLFSRKHIRIVSLKTNKDLPYVNELFNTGKLKPFIDGHFQLEEIHKAFDVYAKAEHKGKLVLTVTHSA